MPAVSLDSVKRYLKVTQSSDDTLLQQLIDGAEDEALAFMDREQLPRRGEYQEPGANVGPWCKTPDSNDKPEAISDADDLAPVVWMGIALIVQAMYEGKDAAEMAAIRQGAMIKWQPYRNRLGV